MLVLGQQIGAEVIDADFPGDGLGGMGIVAGEHDDLETVGTQPSDRGHAVVTQGVADTEDGGEPAIDGQMDDAACLALKRSAMSWPASSATPGPAAVGRCRATVRCLPACGP